MSTNVKKKFRYYSGQGVPLSERVWIVTGHKNTDEAMESLETSIKVCDENGWEYEWEILEPTYQPVKSGKSAPKPVVEVEERWDVSFYNTATSRTSTFAYRDEDQARGHWARSQAPGFEHLRDLKAVHVKIETTWQELDW